MTSPPSRDEPYWVHPDHRYDIDSGDASDAVDKSTGDDASGVELDRYRPGGDLYGEVISEAIG